MDYPTTWDTAYPGSMVKKVAGSGDYVKADDLQSLLAAIELLVKIQKDEIEDLQTALNHTKGC